MKLYDISVTTFLVYVHLSVFVLDNSFREEKGSFCRCACWSFETRGR